MGNSSSHYFEHGSRQVIFTFSCCLTGILPLKQFSKEADPVTPAMVQSDQHRPFFCFLPSQVRQVNVCTSLKILLPVSPLFLSKSSPCKCIILHNLQLSVFTLSIYLPFLSLPACSSHLNIMVEWLAHPFHFWEAQRSDVTLDALCILAVFLWVFSLCPGCCWWNITLN
jgi:hypothetical protein